MSTQADVTSLQRTLTLLAIEKQVYREIYEETSAPKFATLIGDIDTAERVVRLVSTNLESTLKVMAKYGPAAA